MITNQPQADVPDQSENWISIALVARPQGHRGEVIADLLTDFPDRFSALEKVTIKRSDGQMDYLRLEKSRIHKGRVVLKFAGYDDMNAAEDLRGARLMVPRSQLIKLPENRYYEFDLIDCQVLTEDEKIIGKVVSVEDYGAAPLLAVKSGDQEHLIPLASSICINIDIPRKRIVIAPPEGLLEL